jgi:lipoprotein-anchoring transpeptidase ErfK/SrfK
MTAWVKTRKVSPARGLAQWSRQAIAASSATLVVLLGQGQVWAAESNSAIAPSNSVNSSTTAQWPELPPLGDAAAYLPDTKAKIRVVLRLSERRVYLYEDDEVAASYPVAIGKSSTPTPTGEFKIFQLIENPTWKNPWTGQVTTPGPNSALGLRWIGFAEMPNGIIGFHGTPTLSSIGQAASNGCVRMRNEDVVALFEKLEMGTSVTVVH